MEQRGVKSVMQALRYAPGVSTENKGGAVVRLTDWVKIRRFDSSNNYYSRVSVTDSSWLECKRPQIDRLRWSA